MKEGGEMEKESKFFSCALLFVFTALSVFLCGQYDGQRRTDIGFVKNAYAAGGDEYSSNVKSPTGTMSPRSMYFPGTEKLAPNEMRIISCGTGMPAARRSQAATCWLLELGNGDKFLFDIGTGSGANIGSLNIPYDYLDKVFVSHLHSDHVGDMDSLWIGGWTGGRHGALNVWGPSGAKPELGTKHFVEKLKDTFSWDYAGRLGIIPTGGGDIKVTEFDYRQVNKVVYEKNGVTIRSWPAIHAIDGSVSYGVEWNGLKFVFGGDTIPNKWYAKFAKNADIAIHECFMPPNLMMEKYGFSAAAALNVAVGVHTPPASFGKVMSDIKPRLAIAYHFFNDFDTRYPIQEGIRRTYDGPLTMATDLLVWNVTKDDIRVRQVIVDDESWPAKSPTKPGQPDASARVAFSPFIKDGELDMSKTLDPLIEKFKKENNLK
jgi:ribonuclease Z